MVNTKEIFNDLNLVARLNQHIEDIASDDAITLAKESSFKVLAELSSIANPDTRSEAQFEHQREEFRLVDGSCLPFHLQGDQAFNEASVLARRRQLRHSDSIKVKITFLWQVAQGKKATVQSHAGANDPATTSPHPREDISIIEQDYSEMMLLIFKVLRDDFVLETARKQIQCDWEVDSHHGSKLSFQQFFLAVFELVDVWTCDILEATYVRFLELLTRRITVRVVVFLDDMKLKLALSDNFDEAVVVKAIPLSTIKKFASVAKVMEGTGIRTVGELARTDPRLVETQRVGYLERYSVAPGKIGADLQQLLNMFREISQQFQQANYSFQNQVLQRLQSAEPQLSDCSNRINEGTMLGSTNQRGSSAATSPESAPKWLSASHSRGMSLSAEGTLSRNLRASALEDERVRLPRSVEKATESPGAVFSQSPDVLTTDPAAELKTGRLDFTVAPIVAKNDSTPDIKSSDSLHSKSRTFEVQDGIGGEAEVLRWRGIKRINTFHDLSTTDGSVIDALKAAFLIEKGISIQRKTELNDIRDQLIKFGVDADTLEDDAAAVKYGSLYETFVLRDGDNIRSLAQSILAQIKMELAAHGIVVNDDEVEAMYDGFYGSVITGSGEGIVAEAKSWVDDAVANRSYDAYIKHDYHELKSIGEVHHFGVEADDGEFVSLISIEPSDDDDDDREALGRKAEAVLPRTPASLSRRPSLYRSTLESPVQEKLTVQADQRVPGKAFGIELTTVDESNSSVHFHDSTIDATTPTYGEIHGDPDCDSGFDRHRLKREHHSGESIDDSNTHESITDSTLASQGFETSSTTSEISDVLDTDAFVATHHQSLEIAGEVDPTPQEEVPSVMVEAESRGTAVANVTVSTIIAQNDGLNDPTIDEKRSVVAISSHGHHVEQVSSLVAGRHIHDNEADRAVQGIAYVYDTTDGSQQDASSDRGSDQVQPREPKIPDIVVSGVDDGRHIAVTARYIHLLGLGSVAVIQPESDFFARLVTETSRGEIDLVCFDVGDKLDSALAKTKEIVALASCPVILFGGNEHQPELTEVVARRCVSEGGARYFATLPIEFPALRGEILAVFDSTPELYILRQRRPSANFGSTTRLMPNARATNMLIVEEDHPRSVLTPPLAIGSSGAKRKATATMAATVIPPLLPLPLTTKKTTFVPFQAVRAIDEMPGVEFVSPSRFSPVVPPGSSSKASRKSPRMSAALKRLMR